MGYPQEAEERKKERKKERVGTIAIGLISNLVVLKRVKLFCINNSLDWNIIDDLDSVISKVLIHIPL